MNAIDFDYLTIHTHSGWREGHAQTLSVDEKGRLILASKATLRFTDMNSEANNLQLPTAAIEWQSIAFDRHNQLHLLSKKNCQLYRYSKQRNKLEHIYSFSSRETKESNPQFEQLAFSQSTLYLLDIKNSLIHAYFYPEFQFRYFIGHQDNSSPTQQSVLDNPIAIETDHQGHLFVLDAGKRCIFKFNASGSCVQKISLNVDNCVQRIQQPVSFALGPTPVKYLLLLDSASCSIFKYDFENQDWQSFASLLSINPLFNPQTIGVDKFGIVSIAGNSKLIYQFDSNGSYVAALDVDDECFRLSHDNKGELYGICAEEKQIVHFGSTTEFALTGRYISKVLDSTIHQCHWHRIALDIQQPEKTRFVVHYFSSDNIISVDQIRPEQWQTFINSSDYAISDALFENAIGQYLILKFEFSGDGLSSPSVDRVRVYFQRDSYLRYLPATYQEDANGKYFVERFLSLYESMSLQIEEQINNITQYFDTDVQGKEFLDWLSSWLAIMVDENWPESKQRSLLKESFDLYRYRGTQKTLRRVIEIFTGSNVAIIEHWRLQPPMILNQMNKVGINSFVGPKRTQRLIIEETSRIGEFTLDEHEDSPEAPFAKDAYDFTVMVDTSKLTGTSYLKTLQRLIEAEKPAHTRYFLRTQGSTEATLGTHSLLGIDTVLGKGPQPMRIGLNSRIGQQTLVGNRYRIKGRLDTRASSDIDAIIL